MSPTSRIPKPPNTKSSRSPREKSPEDNPAERTKVDEHEGATEKQVGDTTGPGAGYDQEPVQERDKGGVTPS